MDEDKRHQVIKDLKQLMDKWKNIASRYRKSEIQRKSMETTSERCGSWESCS